MRDDHFFDRENGAAKPADRSGDAPSPDRGQGRYRANRRWSEYLGDLRSQCWIDVLRLPRPRKPVATELGRLRQSTGFQRLVVAGGIVSCLGLASIAETHNATVDAAIGEAASVEIQERADEAETASRSERTAEPSESVSAQPEETATADPVPTEPAEPDHPGPGKRESGPVAGLSDVQMNNAKAIVWTGVDMGMPRRALIIAVATAMQESNLLNRASEVVPESKLYPHQGTGWDHDSVGLFQQRPSAGWGPVRKLMDPAYASQQFYRALMRVPGWENMRLTEAAQAVQVSAFPEHYAKHEHRATIVVDALIEPE
jgi:hypothetical protein